MDSDSVRLIILMAVLVLFSSFFSSAETAFSSLNKVKLKAMMSSGKNTRRIERALALSEDYDVVLSTILIGNNLVNIACTSISRYSAYFVKSKELAYKPGPDSEKQIKRAENNNKKFNYGCNDNCIGFCLFLCNLLWRNLAENKNNNGHYNC